MNFLFPDKEKKLTETEIMKGLECCIERRDLKQCNNYDCPLQYKTSTFAECKKMLVEAVLDLINSKNAELRQLAYEHTELMKKVDCQKAEIEKWQQVNFDLCCAGGKLLAERKTIRAEAIKEFVKRVKTEGKKNVDKYTPEGCDLYFSNGTLCGYVAMKEVIDQIAKEMGVEL